MKQYSVVKTGDMPSIIEKYADKYNGQPVNKDVFLNLDSDIEFLVVDCRECHGNTNKSDKSAWLTDKANNWNVRFDVATFKA